MKKKMNKTRSSYLKALFIIIAVVILILDVIFILLPDKKISETENRSLEQFPKLNFTTLTNGKFETRFDRYVADQFPARNAWVGLKSTADILGGKTENNNIFLAKDGYLIQNMTMPDDEAYQEKIDTIKKFKEAHPDLAFSALVAPTALSVLEDHLPANAVHGDEEALFERVKTDISETGIKFIDVRDELKAAKEEEQIYYRTDHHWTSAGAYEAYKVLAKDLGLKGKDTKYEAKLVSDTFKGTLNASSAFRTSETDPLYVYLPKEEKPYSVFYVFEGRRTATFYEVENLNVRDHYTIFFNGNHPEIKIETGAEEEKSLLVIKDSYANCFVPFLAPDYKKIVMVDPRYFTDDIDALISTEQINEVLYLYNISTFAQ